MNSNRILIMQPMPAWNPVSLCRKAILLLLLLPFSLPSLYLSAQTFRIDTISDALFQRIWEKSYKRDCTVPRSELRYLQVAHYNGEGKAVQGEIVCNKAIANDLIQIFKELYQNKYPIERMQLIDDYDADDERSMEANNTSCFNFRFIAGSTKLSNHSRGMAIDINPLYNPFVLRRSDGSLFVQPEKGRKYANRKEKIPYKIDEKDLCYRLFIQHGFTWGGSWTTRKDYQHFEK